MSKLGDHTFAHGLPMKPCQNPLFVASLKKNWGASLMAQQLKNPPAMQETGDMGLIPGSGRSLGGGNDNPLQYSCLENPMDRGAWLTIVQRVAKSWTCLKD